MAVFAAIFRLEIGGIRPLVNASTSISTLPPTGGAGDHVDTCFGDFCIPTDQNDTFCSASRLVIQDPPLSTIRVRGMRRVWQRVIATVMALPFAMLLTAAAIGTGATPQAVLGFAPFAYLITVLVTDLKDAWSGDYRFRPRYWIGWSLAVLPSFAWLVWLQLLGLL